MRLKSLKHLGALLKKKVYPFRFKFGTYDEKIYLLNFFFNCSTYFNAFTKRK